MSRSIAQPTLTINYDNCETYLSNASNAKIHYTVSSTQKVMLCVEDTSAWGNVTLNTAAKNAMFPTDGAVATKAEISYSLDRPTYLLSVSINGKVNINGTDYVSGTCTSSDGSTPSGTANCSITKDTPIKLFLQSTRSGCRGFMPWIKITIYCTRYDFSASAGANVTSASVSSSTGYDGATIQYRCTLAAGAEWQGWYRNGALYSATKDLNVTVSGTDLALEARATMPVTTKTLSAAYNGAQLQGFPISVQADAPITYGGVSKGAVPFSGGSKTLTCANKICSGNIGIGGKTLQCANKLMASNVVCQIS